MRYVLLYSAPLQGNRWMLAGQSDDRADVVRNRDVLLTEIHRNGSPYYNTLIVDTSPEILTDAQPQASA